MEETAVSISCITYNHVRYLREALEGFLSQETSFGFEVLVHDDASDDGTADILRDYEGRYPGVFRIIYEDENQYSKGVTNVSGVFNFPRARGKYIAMCEGDDFWTDSHKLQKQFDYMEAHPGCAMCCHAARIAAEDGAFRTEGTVAPFDKSGVLAPEEVISKKNNIPTASLFFRAAYARELPDWYYDCPVGDIPVQLFMLLKGDVCYMNETMSVYRMGRGGSWGEMMEKEAAERGRVKWEEHFAAMRRLYEAFDRDSGYRWSGAVAEALARQRFQIDLKEGDMAAVRDPVNKKFLMEMPPAERGLLSLKAWAPGFYDALRRAYLAVSRK